MHQCNSTPQIVHSTIEEHPTHGVKRSHQEAFPDSSTSTLTRIASTALSPGHDPSSDRPEQNSTSTIKRARTINSDLQNPLTTIIPIELLVKEILPRCDSQSLVHLQLTCSQLHSIIKDETKLYKDLLIKLALKKVLEIDETNNPYQKIYALCAFAMIQAPLNPEHANELLQEAIHASADLCDIPPPRFFSDPSPSTAEIPHLIKSQTLALIADVQKFMDLERAIGTANQIPNIEIKEQILAGIALQQSLTDISKALEIITAINDLQLKEEVLGDIAKQQALTDIKNALVITEMIEDTELKAITLSHIAQQQALTDTEKALDIANQIVRDNNRSTKLYIQALYHIYELEALVDLPQALSHMQSIAINAKKKKIANAAGEAKECCLNKIIDRLITTHPEEALAAAKLIETNDLKHHKMAQIIAKRDPELAQLQVIYIHDPYIKVFTLCDLAKELITTNPEKANTYCQIAAELAKSHFADYRFHNQPLNEEEDRDNNCSGQMRLLQNDQDNAFSYIARTLALFNIGAAITIARLIKDQRLRESIFSNIANVHASKHFEDVLAWSLCEELDQYPYRENRIQPSKMQAQQFPSLFKAGVSANPERLNTYFPQAVKRATQIWRGPKLSQIIIELTKIFAETNPSNGNC